MSVLLSHTFPCGCNINKEAGGDESVFRPHSNTCEVFAYYLEAVRNLDLPLELQEI